MKKTLRKIIPALVMLMISAMLVGTSTYAWFAMNQKVTVTGMTVKTKVGSNLTLSETNADLASYNAYGLNQTVSGTLEPVSTINGVDFYWTSTENVNPGDGSPKTATYTQYTGSEYTPTVDDAFDANYGFNTADTQEAFAYKDYGFYIQATNSDVAAKNLSMTKCNITYQGGAIGSDKAWRVAVFAVSTTLGSTVANNTAAAAGNLKTILRPSGATYYTDTDQAVSGTTTKAGVNSAIDDAATIVSINPNTTVYYKIVVRLWLEGEDSTCNNTTYATLTKDYNLDLKFELTSSAGVVLLGSEGNVVVSASNLVGTVTLSNTDSGAIYNGETAASFQWKVASTGNNATGEGNTTYQYTATAEETVYCEVTTDRGNKYRSANVTLAPAP